MKKDFLKFVQQQKERLIRKNPELKYYFVDVYHAESEDYIPFLPIRAFRDFHITTLADDAEKVRFVSSGSTNAVRALHSFDQEGLQLYKKHTFEGFQEFLNRFHIQDAVLFSFVPSPTEWPQSSIAAMLKMFEECGYPVRWCKNVQNFNRYLKSIDENKSVIVFGTTFHYLQFIQEAYDLNLTNSIQNFLKKRNVYIVDTGGTKGRTRAFDAYEINKILRVFYTSKNTEIFSEYGMCELSSQAWSANKNHDGTFVANKTLLPFAIDLQTNKILEQNAAGYLGYIDTINVHSYPAIITEDIGQILSYEDGVFKLFGRSPNASIKGCSLNVQALQKSLGLFEKPILNVTNELNSHLNSRVEQRVFNLDDLIKRLNADYWLEKDILDLKNSLESLNKIDWDNQKTLDELADNEFYKKSIFLIAAANTPIAFVYPMIIAALSSANSFTLKIPSIRIDDPFSLKVQNQIKNLFTLIASYFPYTQFQISCGGSLTEQFQSADCVIAYGTNETIELIKKSCPPRCKFFGFGDVKNSFMVDLQTHTSKDLAQLCSTWNGRGCLTPVCLFVDADWNYQHTEQFFDDLSKEMHIRFNAFKNYKLHDHARMFCTAQLKKLMNNNSKYDPLLIEKSVLFSDYATVVDLSRLTNKDLEKLKIDLSFGGSGFVYLIHKKFCNMYADIEIKTIFPKINVPFYF